MFARLLNGFAANFSTQHGDRGLATVGTRSGWLRSEGGFMDGGSMSEFVSRADQSEVMRMLMKPG